MSAAARLAARASTWRERRPNTAHFVRVGRDILVKESRLSGSPIIFCLALANLSSALGGFLATTLALANKEHSLFCLGDRALAIHLELPENLF